MSVESSPAVRSRSTPATGRGPGHSGTPGPGAGNMGPNFASKGLQNAYWANDFLPAFDAKAAWSSTCASASGAIQHAHTVAIVIAQLV
jgi:hypothetical protein